QFNPNRADWARKKCSIITDGPLFEVCRLHITNYMDYYKNCLYDACGCDSGGDCECLCTSVATFAKECSDRGFYIKWRSQHFCRQFFNIFS
ncbi:hypothetical protein HELRODRAFT_145797, partial [Helobdella robusta]|uniref:VWF/SSPO/Zonadhesin-like cysteine-rich domain-containing protein n=1 Tax=Helobdella robusta TaxID=6412 RepID=T1EJN0_HELRO